LHLFLLALLRSPSACGGPKLLLGKLVRVQHGVPKNNSKYRANRIEMEQKGVKLREKEQNGKSRRKNFASTGTLLIFQLFGASLYTFQITMDITTQFFLTTRVCLASSVILWYKVLVTGRCNQHTHTLTYTHKEVLLLL
jgi:hypothetical protein